MLTFKNIHKSFGDLEVLKGIDLSFDKGEFVAVIGASGCGKTTLIRTVNGFVVPDRGKVIFDGEEVIYSDKGKLRQIRKKVGMVYQLFNLIERTSSLHNVLTGVLGRMDQGFSLIMSLLGIFGKENNRKAMEYLDFVGIKNKHDFRVDKLSGGQKQRVAIARALMQDPRLLLADEPIANLDPKTAKKLLVLLSDINKKKGLTIIIVLHHIDFVRDFFERAIGIKDGEVVFDDNPNKLDDHTLDYIYSGHSEEVLAWETA